MLTFDEIMLSHLPSKIISVYEIPEEILESGTVARDIILGDGLSDLKISVFGEEGTLPHFHMFKHIGKKRDKIVKGKRTKNNNTFHTCICLMENRYFPHPGKTDILNSGQMDELYKILSEKFDDKNTLYQKLCKDWNEGANRYGNGLSPFIPNKCMRNMPDYRDILPYKSDKEIKRELEELLKSQNKA